MGLSQQSLPELSYLDWADGNANTRAAFAKALAESLIEFGFVIIKDQTAVAPETLKDAYTVMEGFFAKDTAYKSQYKRGDGGQRGYIAFGREHAKDAKIADLKEFWHVGQPNIPLGPDAEYYDDNIWPDYPGFQSTFLDMFKGLECLGLSLLEALGSQITDNSTLLSDMARQGNSILRLLHYPPIPKDVTPGALRAAAHEDINLITLLVAANGRGLQLLTRDGEWLEVETAPENIIVDSGDMLAHMSGGKIPATTHRVINAGDLSKSRYSIPFFMHPRPSCILGPIPGFTKTPEEIEPVTAIEALNRRLAEIGLKT